MDPPWEAYFLEGCTRNCPWHRFPTWLSMPSWHFPSSLLFSLLPWYSMSIPTCWQSLLQCTCWIWFKRWMWVDMIICWDLTFSSAETLVHLPSIVSAKSDQHYTNLRTDENMRARALWKNKTLAIINLPLEPFALFGIAFSWPLAWQHCLRR